MTSPNEHQKNYWNSDAGSKWIINESILDGSMQGVLTRVLERVSIRSGERILDIGCGTGISTLTAAAATGLDGHVTGLDIAPQLLDRAQARSKDAALTNTNFVLADAQTHGFEDEEFDALMSRFGVMFFSDPVEAFANMATALRSKGRMVFATWGSLSGNPWFHIPRDAAVAQLGAPSPQDPLVPGPLAFQDGERVMSILLKAGLKNVVCDHEIVPLVLPGNAKNAASIACELGPANRILEELSGSEDDKTTIQKEIADAFFEFETDSGLSIPASINFFSATKQ